MTDGKSGAKKQFSPVPMLLILCLFLLHNPNFNTIDIFPDFIAYFILARLTKRYSECAPYFAEFRSACIKLGFVTLAKIPAMFIMLSNMRSGRDIVPLFALVFATAELALLYPAIKNGFSALFYVSERSDLHSVTASYKFMGIRVSPEFMEMATLVFVSAKAIMSVLPEFCLLTFGTDVTIFRLRSLYPVLTVFSLLSVLILGIAWLLLARGYIRAIHKEGGLGDAVTAIAGIEKLARLERERAVKKKLGILTILSIASLFTIDIVFDEVSNGAPIIPRCIYILLMMFAAYAIFEQQRDKRMVLTSGALYSAVSLIQHFFVYNFGSQYSFSDFITDTGVIGNARSAYLPVEICAPIEALLALVFSLALARGFVRFLTNNTGISAYSAGYGKRNKEFREQMTIKGYIYAFSPALIALMKCINVFFRANVQLIYSDPDDITQPAIVASSVPWFGMVIIAVCVAYVFYSFYFISEVKSEVKMKFSDEKMSLE